MSEDMDLTDTIIPRSDQLNAEDLLTGPLTVTITAVRRGNAEQPIEIVLAEFGDRRPFKPSKTVRRILVSAWGKDGNTYVGKRMTIYRDPTVRFGGQDVGGIRVSHLSHIPKRITLALTVTRGRRAPYTVDPLPDAPPPTITREDRRRLTDMLAEAGLSSKDEALDWIGKQLGRNVTTTETLTRDDATRLFDALDRAINDPDPAPQDVPHDGMDEFTQEADHDA